MLKGKSLLMYTIFFSYWSRNEWSNIKIFSKKSKYVKMYCNVHDKYRKFKKKLKYHTFLKKQVFLLFIMPQENMNQEFRLKKKK